MSDESPAESDRTQLLNTLRSLADGVIASDFAGRVTFMNRSAERLTGWPAAEGLGRPLTEVFRISHPSGEAAEFFLIGAGRKDTRVVLLTRRDGELVAIEDNSSPIRDNDGSLMGLVVLFRPRADGRAMSAQHETPVGADMLESIGDPLFCLDGQWRLTYANGPAAEAFRRDRQSLIGRVLWNLLPPSIHRKHYQDFGGALLRRESRQFELHDESTDRWWHASLYPFHDGLLVFLKDLTAEKAAKEEAARIDRLESLGLLARGFAHDFNNLLTVMLGNLSLVQRRSGADAPLAQELEAARQATLQAQGLVQNLLTFAKGGAPVRRRMRWGTLIEEICGSHPQTEGIGCQCVIGPQPADVEIDPQQIRRLVSNLLRNAEQAIPAEKAGRILVRAFSRLRAAGEPSDQPQAVLEVIDNGSGIDPASLARVFEPYFTTRAEENASGLGLTVCESIVKSHSGRIAVQSQPGQTIFTVTLPAVSRLAATPPPLPAAVAAAARHQVRVLVLEDEPLIRQLISANLASNGYLVDSTVDGAETVRLYHESLRRGTPYDLVILDLSVPKGQGGRETMEQLRRLHPSVRAIVSSGYSDDALMSRYLDFGFRAVLPKPYEPHELVAVVREVLQD